MQQHKLYINGEYINSTSEETIDVVNPATEKVISRIFAGTEDDANKAIEAAYEAQKKWERVPSADRGKIVRELGDKLKERRETFIELLSEEQGKPYEQASGEVDTAIDYFYYMSEWARRIEGEIIPSDRPNENILMFRKPIGVVAGIVPWNFPVFILARKVATALITGCSIVLKPSQQTPNTAAEFTKIIAEMKDIPAGVYNFITGKGSTIGTVMASHPKVGIITMTGSVKAGTKVMEAAAKNITKVNLELGGKAPAIVTKNANIETAVKSIKTSRITNSGQACTNAERVYVHEDIAEEFIEKMTQAMKETKLGMPTDKNAEMGPLVSQDRLDIVHEMVEKAVQSGAKVLTGGKRADMTSGFFYEPTVITNVQQDSEIIQEEIFGPVLPIMTYKTLDEAIELANDSDYGLSSSIYTENVHEAMRAANELKFGETFINRENFEAIQGYHAGLRKSGLGGADGKHGIEDFTVTHAVYMQYDDEKQ
ncbi:aldehyde dehydrogenase [Metabacillus idriensis]|uniref:3-sulfolactaldehyde dehydrogenase n=1 Tax=Metabacillus idriensis TaxID=324768 RepID=A0A6I2M4V2_9BACI|nr:aldehyde dehydrogenase [Metabacillus idriensis]MCM3594804.1 aldehyde dehydrogenase [Metabacillus idriensis]MRX53175.1 aldehyde dehydrogenase [Metabacillus idriensis]OHR66215.1 aldehyde dehydrogenase [Bacillus sp. HMSC76G11]